jgi:hypothetical protein
MRLQVLAPAKITSMDLRYPIGKFDKSVPVASEAIPDLIGQILSAPSEFRDAVEGLNDEQLDTPYRPEGWTVRQTIHHVADSHMNMYVRYRLALTEIDPVIKTYDEAKWAELVDARTMPVAVSLQLLDAMHHRWAVLLRSMCPADFERTYRHPELGPLRLDTVLALYAWHGHHHTAHITRLRDRFGWS